jgi:hypothetical protein
MKETLQIGYEKIDRINQFFLQDDNPVIEPLLNLVEKYGGPDRINQKARSNGRLELLMERVRQNNPEYAANLEWLKEQRDTGKFVSMDAYNWVLPRAEGPAKGRRSCQGPKVLPRAEGPAKD